MFCDYLGRANPHVLLGLDSDSGHDEAVFGRRIARDGGLVPQGVGIRLAVHRPAQFRRHRPAVSGEQLLYSDCPYH